MLLAEFSLNSGLREAFKNHEKGATKNTAFSPTSLQTPRHALEYRLQTFLNKWQETAVVVDSVPFKYRDEKQKVNNYRRTLVISVSSLSEGKKNELKTDYQNLIGAHTVSFPMKEKASHTLVQFNGSIYDLGYAPIQYFMKFRDNDYKVPESRRLESVMLLTSLEENRLADYISNIKEDRYEVLGKFDLNGYHIAKGKLDNNETLACGHNCTSWIMTAPIGSKNETLMTLLGGEQSVPWIAQNPGWMGSWIASTAKQERVPLVVYWTPEKLQDSLTKEFAEGSPFSWDFNRK